MRVYPKVFPDVTEVSFPVVIGVDMLCVCLKDIGVWYSHSKSVLPFLGVLRIKGYYIKCHNDSSSYNKQNELFCVNYKGEK